MPRKVRFELLPRYPAPDFAEASSGLRHKKIEGCLNKVDQIFDAKSARHSLAAAVKIKNSPSGEFLICLDKLSLYIPRKMMEQLVLQSCLAQG